MLQSDTRDSHSGDESLQTSANSRAVGNSVQFCAVLNVEKLPRCGSQQAVLQGGCFPDLPEICCTVHLESCLSIRRVLSAVYCNDGWTADGVLTR